MYRNAHMTPVRIIAVFRTFESRHGAFITEIYVCFLIEICNHTIHVDLGKSDCDSASQINPFIPAPDY